MSDNKNKKLANLIKADLQDVLANDSRWNGDYIFNDYFTMNESIWVDTDNQEISEAVAANACQNYNKRKQKWEKEKREWERRGENWHWIQFTLNDMKIEAGELEPDDHNEIVNLINQAKQLWEKKHQQWREETNKKLDSNPNLYYYGGRGNSQDRAGGWLDYGDKKGGYLGMTARENGRGYCLNIVVNHSVLDTFSFQKGFYLIDTSKSVEKNDGIVRPWSTGGEDNPNNFHKWIEVNDQITITPYNGKTNQELPENWKKELEPKGKTGCDTCHKKLGRNWGGSDNFYIIKRYHGEIKRGEWVCSNCYPTKEAEYLQNYAAIFERFKEESGEIDYRLIKAEWIDCYAGKKDQNGQILKQRDCSHCQPWKQHQISNPENVEELKQIATFLLHYFQEHDIKKISLRNGELIITHNNNEIVSQKQINHELQNVENYLMKRGENTLELQQLLNELSSSSNSTSDSPKKDYTPHLIGGTIGVGLATLTIIGFCLRKSKKTKKRR